jgi:hypothetical protein
MMTNFIQKWVHADSAKGQGNCCGVEIKEVSAESQEKAAESCCTETNETSSSCCTTDTKENSSSCCG